MSKKRQDNGARILWRKIRTPEKPDVNPEEIEDRLWMYTGQLLSEKEEIEVAELIACHPEVENRVDQIRATIDSVPEASWPVRIGCARAAAKRMATAVGLRMSEINGFVARMGHGLVPLFTTPDLGIAQPVMLGGDNASAGAPPQSGMRVDLPEKQGLQISVIYAPGGAVNLLVRALQPPDEGELKVSVATGFETNETGEITEWMRKGEAHVEDCPTGLIRIEAPGNRIQHICLEDIAEPLAGKEERGNG